MEASFTLVWGIMKKKKEHVMKKKKKAMLFYKINNWKNVLVL